MSYFRRLLTIGVLLSLTTVMSFALKAEYRFEECSGVASLKDYTGNGFDGVLKGDANITLKDGKIINALTMSGDGMMIVNQDADLDIVEDLTIAFWVKPSEIKKQALVTKGFGSGKPRKYATNAEYFIMMKEGGKLAYKHNGVKDNTVVAYTDGNISANEWTHVVFVRDNSAKTMRFYINGVANSEYKYVNNPETTSSERVVFGQCDGCVKPYKLNGKLDEIKIYGIALSKGDITSMYDSENSGKHSTGGCNLAPEAKDDTAEIPLAGTVTVDVLANDRENDSATCSVDASTVVIVSNPSGTTLNDNGKILTVPSEGVWSVEGSGSITFKSENSFRDSPTVIAYRVTDSCGSHSNEANVILSRETTGGGTEDNSSFTIGDRVWYDSNKNGIQDSGEEGVEGVTVVLYDANGSVVSRATTDAVGQYLFTNINAGDYSIGFSALPTGYIFTSKDMGSSDAKDSDADSNGRTALFTIGNISDDLIYDAGVVSNGTTPDNGSDEECKCEDYTSTIPSINNIGMIVTLLLTGLLGVFLLRREELYINIK